MRLAVSRLEDAVNQSLGAQVLQSSKRKFNDQIPFILDLSIEAGYRQFIAKFSTPPGLNSTHPDRQLLFYEYQHAATTAFSDPTIIETPANRVVIEGIGLNETRFFRVRTINTKFQASRWSTTVSATSAKGEIIITKLSGASDRITSDIGTWQTIISKDYTNTGGAIFLMAHIALGVFPNDVTQTVSPNATFSSGPAHVQFRWTVDDVEFGERTILSGRPSAKGSAQDLKVQMPFGTFMSEFKRFTKSETNTFKLQAALQPGSEWRGLSGGGSLTKADPLVFVRQGKLTEVIEEF
jgi:hypothetical protein